MLTKDDYTDIRDARTLIDHAREGSKRIPFETILAILDFVLIGIKTIFFDKMGKPKNKLQLIMSLPAIIKFVREVVKRIGGDQNKTNRVKGLSNEAKAVKAIQDGVNRVKKD